MRLCALDLEPTRVLHELLARGLRTLSSRAAALSSEVAPEHGDALGYLATDIARLAAIVDVLLDRERFPANAAAGGNQAPRH